MILDPTLALIRSQLGFKIQVRAECGNENVLYSKASSYNFDKLFFQITSICFLREKKNMKVCFISADKIFEPEIPILFMKVEYME